MILEADNRMCLMCCKSGTERRLGKMAHDFDLKIIAFVTFVAVRVFFFFFGNNKTSFVQSQTSFSMESKRKETKEQMN